MRRSEREVFDYNKIDKLLKESKILRLGLKGDEYPYIIPLHYGYEYNKDTNKIVFFVHSAKVGKKIDLIRDNNNVCIEIDGGATLIDGKEIPCKFSAKYMSLIGFGRGEIIDDVEEKKVALKASMKNQTDREFDFSDDMTKSVEVIKIELDSFSVKANE